MVVGALVVVVVALVVVVVGLKVVVVGVLVVVVVALVVVVVIVAFSSGCFGGGAAGGRNGSVKPIPFGGSL